MARNFEIENDEYIKILEEIRKIDIPETHWIELNEFFRQENKFNDIDSININYIFTI